PPHLAQAGRSRLPRRSAAAHPDGAHRRAGGSGRRGRLPVPAGVGLCHRRMHRGGRRIPALRVLTARRSLLPLHGPAIAAALPSCAPLRVETPVARRKTLELATFNVNGIGTRLPHLLAWLEKEAPDIVALQELKAVDVA